MLLVCDVCMYRNGEIKNGLNLPVSGMDDLFQFLCVPLGMFFVLLPYVIRCFRLLSLLVLNLVKGFCTVGLCFCIFGFSCTIAYAFCTIAHLFCIFGLVFVYCWFDELYYCKGDFNGL